MIDYKFKKGDWFSTEGLTEKQYQLIEQEVYEQGILNCADYNGWTEHTWNKYPWGIFSDGDIMLFGSCELGDHKNKLDTDILLKQIREAQMEKQTENIKIKAGQTYRKTQKSADDNRWWIEEPVGFCMVTHHKDYDDNWWDEDHNNYVNEEAVRNGWVELVEDPAVSFDINNWYLETEGLTKDQEKIICDYLVINYKEGWIGFRISQGECLCWDYVGVKDGKYQGDDKSEHLDSIFKHCLKITYEQFETLVSKDNQEGDEMEQTDNSVLTLDDKANQVKQLKEKLQAAQQQVSDIENELKESEEDLHRSVMEACGVSVGVSVSVPVDGEEKINDYKNWKVGDQVKCLVDYSGYFIEDEVYKIEKIDLTDQDAPVRLDNGYWTEFGNGDEFIKVN